MNFRGGMGETKIIFFCILNHVEGVDGEISIESERSMPDQKVAIMEQSQFKSYYQVT